MSPVAGSTRPGVPSTIRRTAGQLRVPALVRRLDHGVVHDADRVVGVLGGLLDPADDRAGDVGARGDDAVGPTSTPTT